MPLTFQVGPTPFVLRDGSSAILREAEVSDFAAWIRTWRDRLQAANQPDAWFPWRREILRSSSVAGCVCLAIAREGRLEALMSIREGELSRLVPGALVVYIEYLAVAPWNQRDLNPKPEVPGLGSFLVKIAARLSLVLGLQGRLGLHAEIRAEDFYRKLGFTDLGMENTEDGRFRFFELEASAAEKLR